MSVNEESFLRFMVSMTDGGSSHGGRGIKPKEMPEESRLAHEAANWAGHVEIANDKVIISMAGRQRLQQILGQPIFPIRFGKQFDED